MKPCHRLTIIRNRYRAHPDAVRAARMEINRMLPLTDLAERMDFLERVLAQQRPAGQLGPSEKKVVTPH